jgi:hypothetical protein
MRGDLRAGADWRKANKEINLRIINVRLLHPMLLLASAAAKLNFQFF